MNLEKAIKNNLLFLIILLGFFFRSFYFYYNADSQVYVLWLKYLIKEGKLLTFDHPPLFFLLSFSLVKMITGLLSLGSYFYWLLLVVLLASIFLFNRLSIQVRLISSLSLIYFWFVGFYAEIYEIASMISFFAGITAIYLLYKLGKSLFNERVGLISALVLSLSWWHIVYSQIPLVDGVATTCILWAIYEQVRFVKKSKISIKDTILPTLSLIFSLYSKYYSLFIFPGIFLLLFPKFRKEKLYLLPIFVSLITFAPWILYTNFYLPKHYALSHYFFLEFPSKFAFVNFFIKVLTFPLFLLFIFSVFLSAKNKKAWKNDLFLMTLILVPLAIYFKYAYFDGVSHALINLSNYMLYTLPFICLFIGSGLNFIEKRINFKLLGLLGIILISLTLYKLKPLIFLEYDRNYKTARGNLDSLSSVAVKKVPIDLPTLHYKYNFVGASLFQSKSIPRLEIYHRWQSPNNLVIYSIKEQVINLTLFVKSFYTEDILVITYGNYSHSFPITQRGNEINLPLRLHAGTTIIKFKTTEDKCVWIDNQCINFLVEVKAAENKISC